MSQYCGNDHLLSYIQVNPAGGHLQITHASDLLPYEYIEQGGLVTTGCTPEIKNTAYMGRGQTR